MECVVGRWTDGHTVRMCVGVMALCDGYFLRHTHIHVRYWSEGVHVLTYFIVSTRARIGLLNRRDMAEADTLHASGGVWVVVAVSLDVLSTRRFFVGPAGILAAATIRCMI